MALPSGSPNADDDDDGPDERYASERITPRSRPVVGYFALFLGASYAVLGAALLLLPNGRLPLPGTYRVALGLLFIVYGGVRTWRAFRKYYR